MREAPDLPANLIGTFTIVTGGGPLSYLTAIWGNREFPVRQEFGHTAFSVAHPG